MNIKHPLICPKCAEYRFITYRGVRFYNKTKTKGYGLKIPIYICKKCKKIESIIPKERYNAFEELVMDKIKDGEFIRFSLNSAFSKLDDKKIFKKFAHLEFNYDSRDHYIISGLYREWDDGYLTPVFFSKDILLYYNNHPDYSVKLYSFSSGNIYHKGNALFNWGFGINRKGKIFKWLGDLNDDFKSPKMRPHYKRFQASNIKSDHDIVSKFYFSQNPFSEENMFQESDNEVKIFELKNKFDERVLKLLGIKLSKLDFKNLHDYYQHPILEESNQIFNAYLSLTKFLIENLQESELRDILTKNGIAPSTLKGLRSLKLFELFIKHILKIEDVESKIAPLFVLYDLRLLHGHISDSSFTPKYNSCKKRLKARKNISDLNFFTVVVNKLIDFYSELVNGTEPKNGS